MTDPLYIPHNVALSIVDLERIEHSVICFAEELPPQLSAEAKAMRALAERIGGIIDDLLDEIHTSDPD